MALQHYEDRAKDRHGRKQQYENTYIEISQKLTIVTTRQCSAAHRTLRIGVTAKNKQDTNCQ